MALIQYILYIICWIEARSLNIIEYYWGWGWVTISWTFITRTISVQGTKKGEMLQLEWTCISLNNISQLICVNLKKGVTF